VAEPWLSADNIATHKVGHLWKFQASEIDEWVRRDGASASTHDENAE